MIEHWDNQQVAKETGEINNRRKRGSGRDAGDSGFGQPFFFFFFILHSRVFRRARNGIHSVDLGRVFVGLPVLLQQSGKKFNK